MSRTHRQIIALWDSLQAFAADVGVTVVAARKMRQRERIPSAHFTAVLKTTKAQTHGVTFGELHDGAEKPEKPAPSNKPEKGIAA